MAGDSAAKEAETPLALRVERLFAALNDDRYEVRAGAAAEFEGLMERPELGPALAGAVQAALLAPELSFEVRCRLTRWAKRLPPADPPRPEEISAEELDRLVDSLDSDDYGRRLAADARLKWYLGNPKVVLSALGRLKTRFADPSLDTATCKRLDEAWQIAHGRLLTADPPLTAAPPASDAQIDRWLSALTGAAADEKERASCRMAEMELFDCMACDAEAPRVVKAAEARRTAVVDPLGKARLEKLIELARPAMVAEYWAGREHLSEQHLLIGVPSISLGAPRPSHFDHIDDQTAHCVSGNSLSPGDYPANVAIPHPLSEGAFFRLVNLSTPRRRMAYPIQVQVDVRVRLAQISRQTLDRFLAEKRPLTEQELLLMAQLDASEVSRFASVWLMQMDDAPVDDTPVRGEINRERIGGRASRHGMLCAQLAVDGDKGAVPGLLEAIEKDQFLPPISAAPYRLHYLAALSIAQRDPWKEADAWLASQLDNAVTLAENTRPHRATLGATAAAILLKRHDQPLDRFGLQNAPDATLLRLGLNGYCFTTPESVALIRDFLRNQRERQTRP